MSRKLVSWALIALIIILTYTACTCVCKSLESLTVKRIETLKKNDVGLGYTKSDVEK